MDQPEGICTDTFSFALIHFAYVYFEITFRGILSKSQFERLMLVVRLRESNRTLGKSQIIR